MDLSVDVLKLDARFFRGMFEDRLEIVIRSIIDMSKHLHIKTVAEGVDDERHVSLLRDMGCDVIQGLYFSKPMCMTDFLAYIEK